MRATSLPYEVLILVCTNERDETDPRPSCGKRGSVDIHAEIKRRVKEMRLPMKVRVSRSLCLDLCNEGPNVVVFPPGRRYAEVSIEDIERILDDTFGPFAHPPDRLA